MMKKWYQRIITTSGDKGNLIKVLGAIVIFVSLFLPWIKKNFLQSQNFIIGGELLFACFSSASNNFHLITLAAAFSISLIPVLVLLQIGDKIPVILSFGCIILLSVMLLVVPIPFQSYSYGIFCASGGVLIVLLGAFTERT